jgi:hypothetical protein
MLDHRANVVNLGFHGYGPHQMLRSLETDRVGPLVRGPAKQIIYQGIWEHPWRAAGHDGWDFYGPSYRLAGGRIEYAGPFRGHLAGFTLKVLRRSAFFRFALDQTLYRIRLTDADLERYTRILERSARLAREKYGTGLTVVYWDDDTEPSRRVLAAIRRASVPLVLVSEVIPRAEWKGLALPGDPHPGPELNRRLAAALVARFRGPLTAP